MKKIRQKQSEQRAKLLQLLNDERVCAKEIQLHRLQLQVAVIMLHLVVIAAAVVAASSSHCDRHVSKLVAVKLISRTIDKRQKQKFTFAAIVVVARANNNNNWTRNAITVRSCCSFFSFSSSPYFHPLRLLLLLSVPLL